MTRIKNIDPDQPSADHKRIYESVSSTRKGGLGGPFSVWIPGLLPVSGMSGRDSTGTPT